MSRTPPTIVAPLPNDPRVMALAKSVSLTRREAFAAAAEAWAWMRDHAIDDIVMKTAPDSLDAVVDVDGFGEAMFKAGLVGVVNDGLVLPAELRHHERDQRGGRLAEADGADDHEDQTRRRRAGDRARQRRRRARVKVTSPKPALSPSPTAEAAPVAKWTPRRLGTVDGHDVMLLYSPKTQAWFYVLKDASPDEWTASVADPENPSFAEALAGFLGRMKRADRKGLGSCDTFRPSLKAVVDAAERYREQRASAAADAARRDEGNRALAEASADDQDDADHEPAERDCHAHVTPDERDTVTVTEVSRPESVTSAPNSNENKDFGSVTCHGPVTEPAPSSSSSSAAPVFPKQISKENTTTTSGVTVAERDHEDRILDRIAPRVDPEQAKQQDRHRLWLERVAAGLDSSTDGVEYQRKNAPDILLARMKAAGIDPKTGELVNADAPGKPSRARADIGMTTEPSVDDKPVAGSVSARGDDEREHDTLSKVDRLRKSTATLLAAQEIGATLPMKTMSAIHDMSVAEDAAFERDRTTTVPELAAGA